MRKSAEGGDVLYVVEFPTETWQSDLARGIAVLTSWFSFLNQRNCQLVRTWYQFCFSVEMDWLPAVGLALYYIGYYVSLPILFLVKWVLYILYIIFAPFIYTVNTLKEVMLLPFRFLARFEAILYFILSAALLGAALGAVLHFVFRAVIVVFDLNRKPVPKPIPPKGHSVASYREAREAKKQKELERQQRFATQARLMASGPLLQDRVREARQQSSMAGIAPASPGTSRPALLQQTILEHTDEEDDDSVF